jgi:hypothetical protein
MSNSKYLLEEFKGELERWCGAGDNPAYFLHRRIDPSRPYDPEANDFVFRPYYKPSEDKKGMIEQLLVKTRADSEFAWHTEQASPPMVVHNGIIGLLGDLQNLEEQNAKAREPDTLSKLVGRAKFMLECMSRPPYEQARNASGNSVYHEAFFNKFQQFEQLVFAALCDPDAVKKLGLGPPEKDPRTKKPIPGSGCTMPTSNPIFAAAQAKRANIATVYRKQKVPIMKNDALSDEEKKAKCDEIDAECAKELANPELWKEVMQEMALGIWSFLDYRKKPVEKIEELPAENQVEGIHQIGDKFFSVNEQDGKLKAWELVTDEFKAKFGFNVFPRVYEDEASTGQASTITGKDALSVRTQAYSAKRKGPDPTPGLKPWQDVQSGKTVAQRKALGRIVEIERECPDKRYTPIPVFELLHDDEANPSLRPVEFDLDTQSPACYLLPNSIVQVYFQPEVKFNCGKKIKVKFDCRPTKVVFIAKSAYAASLEKGAMAITAPRNEFVAKWIKEGLHPRLTAPPVVDAGFDVMGSAFAASATTPMLEGPKDEADDGHE